MNEERRMNVGGILGTEMEDFVAGLVIIFWWEGEELRKKLGSAA